MKSIWLLKFNLYKRMPWRAMSRLWGQINSIELPHWLRKPAYSLYIWMFECHVEEAVVEDISRYKNLSEFFRRMLKPEMRPIDTNALLTSPADGRVLYCGKVKNGVLEQVKGVTYSLCGFFGPAHATQCSSMFTGNQMSKQCQPTSRTLENESGQTLRHRGFLEDHSISDCSKNSLLFSPLANQLFYCVIYLAPGDYHRFHSPADWYVQKRRHFPGELFSVKPSVARWLKGLFNMNERVVYFGEWVHGFFSMTPVGATNVGSISIYIDKDLKTNMPNRLRKGCYLDKDFVNYEFGSGLRKNVTLDDDEILDQVSEDGDDGIVGGENEEEDSQEEISDTSSICSKETNCSGVFIKKGKLFGEFNLGSTIVLLFEAPKDFKFSVTPGQRINYGQALSTC